MLFKEPGGLADRLSADRPTEFLDEPYMLGCKYGIALFKEVDDVAYNPNVGVEIGFMMAMRKRVLILKDRTLKKLPGDLIHRLYHEIDFTDVKTVEREVNKWFDDLG